MCDEASLERRLREMEVPSLRSGSHRERLKAQLLQISRPLSLEVPEMNGWRRNRSVLKLAAALLVMVSLVATGWTAEKVYQRLTEKCVELEKLPTTTYRTPDGTTYSSNTSFGEVIPADAPPGTEEKLRQHHEEMKHLIAKKEYKLLETKVSPNGKKVYRYEFHFADGECDNQSFDVPLENVTSWEDYVAQQQQQFEQRQKRFFDALEAGRYRLLNIEPLVIHICRDRDTQQTIYVRKLADRHGKFLALFYADLEHTEQGRTDWQDHLEAIRQGKRVLVDLVRGMTCTYEATLADGSTMIQEVNTDVSTIDKMAAFLRQGGKLQPQKNP